MLLAEMDRLTGQGIDFTGRMHISDRAHVIFPYHLEEERWSEEGNGSEKLGTTRRGIGPCYKDKIGRIHGIRIGELYRPDHLRDRLRRIVAFKNSMFQATLSPFTPLDADAITDEYLAHAERLRPYVTDTVAWMNRAVSQGRNILFEGAQGSLLDIDFGTFPYVTSSNSSAAGLGTGSGVHARQVQNWVGIVKAYTTRVGGGPFPTELDNEIGQRIRDRGREYGTVTGRPRRCGWFDAVAVRHSAWVSGATELSVMLLDVLSGFDEIKVAVAYEKPDGSRLDWFPACLEELGQVRPVYETLPGWHEDVTEIKNWRDFPDNFKNYVAFLARQLGVPVRRVSVGPERTQTVSVE
ncbi:MAG: adenylosuccinate synthase, partial [Planctomycetota bacterium]